MEGLIKVTSTNIAEVLLAAKANLPHADVDLLRGTKRMPVARAAGKKHKTDEPARILNKDDIGNMLVLLRFRNSICDNCLKKGDTPLYLCADCKLTFYCSTDCKKAHAEAHAKRCCQANGPLDDGPQKLMFVKVKK